MHLVGLSHVFVCLLQDVNKARAEMREFNAVRLRLSMNVLAGIFEFTW